MTTFWSPDSQKRISDVVRKVERQTEDVTTLQRPPLMRVPHDFRRFRLLTDIDPADDISSQVRALLSSSDLEQIEAGTVKGVGIAIHLRRINGVLTTGETFTVVDLIGNYTGGAATSTTDAAEGWAIHPHDRDWWEIHELAQAGGDTSIWVELKDKMPSSGSVAADQSTIVHPRAWSGSAWITDTDTELTSYDTLGRFRGRGKDDFSGPHDQGSIARIVLNKANNRYEFRDMTPHALWIQGTADANWTTPSTLDIAASAVVMQPSGAIITHTDPAVKIPVNDIRDWEGSSGDIIEAFWDESVLEFKARMVPCS